MSTVAEDPAAVNREAVWRLIYLAAISPGLQPSEVADKATDSLMALLRGTES